MPHMLFYERGSAPSSRSVRELGTLRRHGWEITVAHAPRAAAAVRALGHGSCELEETPPNPYAAALSGQANDLTERLAGLQVLTDELAARFHELRAAGEAERAATVRAELTDTQAARARLAAQKRAVLAARRTTTPLTGGATFGDLARLEPQWSRDAVAMAAVPADVVWAADLDALPAAVWAAQAATEQIPVIFDAHELFCDLAYLPEAFRPAWRALADRFIPLASIVVTVSEDIASVLTKEHGAMRTAVIPNHALPVQPSATDVRAALGLDGTTPLAVHIGNVSTTRNPDRAVDLLAEVAGLHVAFVGATGAGLADTIQRAADDRGMGDRLHFVPPVPLESLTGFITTADLSLILYTGDQSRNLRLAMPNKLFDSLAAGVPVVAAEGTAAAEMIASQGMGRTFPFMEPDRMGAAVREVLADDATRDRVSRMAHQFTWDRVEPALLALVEELHPAAAIGVAL